MNLEGIADALSDAGLGVKGQTLFVDHMPAQCEKGLLVTSQVPIAIDPYIKSLRRGSFQVIVRDNSGADARAVADSVIDAMPGEGAVIADMKFLTLMPQSEPLLFPRSSGDLVEASVNFLFTYIAI